MYVESVKRKKDICLMVYFDFNLFSECKSILSKLF